MTTIIDKAQRIVMTRGEELARLQQLAARIDASAVAAARESRYSGCPITFQEVVDNTYILRADNN